MISQPSRFFPLNSGGGSAAVSTHARIARRHAIFLIWLLSYEPGRLETDYIVRECFDYPDSPTSLVSPPGSRSPLSPPSRPTPHSTVTSRRPIPHTATGSPTPSAAKAIPYT